MKSSQHLATEVLQLRHHMRIIIRLILYLNLIQPMRLSQGMEELVSPQLCHCTPPQLQHFDARGFLLYCFDVFDARYLGGWLVVRHIYYTGLQSVRRLDDHADSFVGESVLGEVELFQRARELFEDGLHIVIVEISVGETEDSVGVVWLVQVGEDVLEMILQFLYKILVDHHIDQMELLKRMLFRGDDVSFKGRFGVIDEQEILHVEHVPGEIHLNKLDRLPLLDILQQ